MNLIDSVKRRLHRDIVADPFVHGLVLNLYLNGERYPHRVGDYFPVAAAEGEELAASMRSHMADEDKHVALYAKAIGKLGQPVHELPMDDIFNEVIRSHTPASFAIEPGDDRDARRLKLAHFLAHAHFLEKRVAHSLDIHVDACAHAASPYPRKAVEAVLHDETRHVRYTREAVGELLPRQQAQDVLALHARAESKANLDFSSRQLGRLMREQARRFPAGSRLIYRACVRGMRGVLACA
jgi:hypothetical protein